MNRHQMIHNRHGQFEVSTDLVRQTLDKITDACCNRNVHALEMVLKSLSQDQLERYLNAMVEGHQINCLDTYFTPLMIASAKEHDSIVRFLLENYSAYCIVDAENYSSQYDFDDDFDVDHVNHQTALWVAVQYEHLNIVQTLISLGKANINQRADKTYTVSNQTPLYLACQHGQTEMVKYLVENGADLYHTNKDDSTALMVACKYEHVDVVEYLLSLDDSDHHLLNASNKEGSTALHEAASTEYLDMVKLLLEEHHAKIIKDNDGLTPLTKAGMVDQQEVVEYLIGNTEHSWYTSSQIIDELELIGSCYVTCSYRENDYVRAYRYLRQAMKLRYRNPTRPILKTNLPAPIDAYGYHIECQTMEELKSLNRNPTRLIIECFMIRERLGGVTSNFLNSLDEQANVGAYDLFSFDPDTLIRTSKECQLALQFWLHSCHLRVQTQIGLNKCVSHLEECVRLMGNLIHRQRTKDIGFDMVMNVLQVAENEFLRNRNLALISDVESIVDQSSSILFDDINMTTIDIADRCLHMIVNLLFIALKVLPCNSKKKQQRRQVLVERVRYFIHADWRTLSDNKSLLHLSLMEYHKSKIVGICNRFPSLPVVQFLLTCRASINAIDYHHRTPLHDFASNAFDELTNDEWGDMKVIFELLVHAGAHLDATPQGKTPLDCVQHEMLQKLFRKHLATQSSLKCLCA